MNEIVSLEGDDLEFFLDNMRRIIKAPVYRIRVARNGEGLSFKVNEQMWSPPLGKVESPR